MSHTPGEWRYVKNYLDFWGDASNCVMRRDMVLADVYGSDADGQLMAVAPKLLAACKALLAWGTTDGTTIYDLVENVVSLAEEAVNDAEPVIQTEETS